VCELPRPRCNFLAAKLLRSTFSEGCLANRPVRLATATAISESSIARIEKPATIRLLHEDPGFAEMFLSYLLSRNMWIEEDLVDQLFNSSEKRLARGASPACQLRQRG
jgi:CRP/FNR family cyclic AMP-dependent transcriptional regulator